MAFKDRPEYNTDKYKALRNKVFTRDNFTCQLTGQKGGELECHHIKKWSGYPDLRFKANNCVTLSKDAHDTILGKEEQFEEFFAKKVAERTKEYYARARGKKTVETEGVRKKYNRKFNPELRY